MEEAPKLEGSDFRGQTPEVCLVEDIHAVWQSFGPGFRAATAALPKPYVLSVPPSDGD